MKKKILILGSGFGLYGYLPAAINCGFRVHTLDRYQTFISHREELSCFMKEIEFVKEENINFKEFDSVVIARTPENQLALVSSNLDYEGHIFLEKPLGVDSQKHSFLIDLLTESKINFSVAYLFRYLDWFQEALNIQGENSSISIDWKIPVGSEDSWKSNTQLGGGLVSYYGIHLFSMLVDFGVSANSMNFSQSQSSFDISGEVNSTLIRFKISSSKTPHFHVEICDQSSLRAWDLLSPFGPVPSVGIEDPRVPAISEYIQSVSNAKTTGRHLIHERKVIEFRRFAERLM